MDTKFKVKFRGGPAHNHTREYDDERPRYTVYQWAYEAAGRRDGDYWVYVLVPKNKMARKLQEWYTQQIGTDPRLMDKPIPVRSPRVGRNEPCYCGSKKKYKKCHLT